MDENFIQQDLFFGRGLPDGGEVSESEFQAFLDEEIAPRFPGLTIFDAQGQVTESTKVVTLFLEDIPESAPAVEEVVAAYQTQFPGAGTFQVANEDDFKVSFALAEDIIDNDAEPELIQADLFFGRGIPDGGEVSEAEFQVFVDNFIVPRFFGLTLFDAQGQVRPAANLATIFSSETRAMT